MIRPFAFVIGACVALASCAQLPVPGLPGSRAPVPQVLAAAQAGAPIMQVIVNDREQSSLVVRETRRDGVETWLAPDGISLSLQDGFLLTTRGLGGDVLGSDVAESRALVLALRPGRATRLHSFLDGDNQVQRRAYICDITRQADAEIALTEGMVATRVMVEDCSSADQQFLNLYWLDRQGQIVQSRQWAGDFAGPLTFRIVR